MLKKPLSAVKKFAEEKPTAMRYAIDGLFVSAAFAIAAQNNNLFALRLGANDFQLSLVQFLPQIFNMLILIPGGLFIDSLFNKRRMVTISLVIIAAGYLLCALSAFSGSHSIYFFLGALTVTAGAIQLHTISWQSYFPDVIETNDRNRVLTVRTLVNVIVSIPAPLLMGAVLTGIAAYSGKIIAHQGFYLVSALLLFMAVYNFRRFEAVRPAVPKRVSFFGIKKAGRSLFRNKPYLLFVGAAVFFHATWHIDWTLYFIGQVRYLSMNEFQLGLTVLGATAAQFLTMRFWSRKNERHGVVLPVTGGILGLSLCPLAMIAAVSMPPAAGIPVFLTFHTLANMTLATITLNVFQCLMQVADDEYRSFSFSFFHCLICLSNAVMPVAGVALYHALGGDRDGLRFAFLIIFALRIIAALIWLICWRLQKPAYAKTG